MASGNGLSLPNGPGDDAAYRLAPEDSPAPLPSRRWPAGVQPAPLEEAAPADRQMSLAGLMTIMVLLAAVMSPAQFLPPQAHAGLLGLVVLALLGIAQFVPRLALACYVFWWALLGMYLLLCLLAAANVGD